jgi:hypothetical protein
VTSSLGSYALCASLRTPANQHCSGAQPDSEKSAGQSLTDKVGRSKDREVHGSSGESVLDKAKNAVGLGDKH